MKEKQADKPTNAIPKIKPPAPTEKPQSQKPKSKKEQSPNYRVLEMFGIVASILGLAIGILSFYPRITVSDPVQMDPRDFFSYQVTVSNDGLLPVFAAKWALALGTLTVETVPNGRHFTLLLPFNTDWTVATSLLESSLKPSSGYRAALVVSAGSELIGPPNFGFRLMPAENHLGFLSPGDRSTLTTEGLIVAEEPGTKYETLDFAISIRYIPIFPPIPMQTCSNFHLYRDRTGLPHWFRARNQCDRFPWAHSTKPPTE